MKHPTRLAVALATLLTASAASAQVAFNTVGGSYAQNFSSLSTSTNNAQTWTNGTTITGWHAASALGGDFTTYTPSWESGISAGVLYHTRNTTEETKRSFLGGRVVSGTGNITIGLSLENATGAALTSFDLSFLASQFFKTGVAQQLQVSFSTDATSLTTGTWTTINALTYTAPYTTGNAAVSSAEEIASRQTLSISAQSINWQADETLWIRWTSFRDLPSFYTSGAAVLAINDVSFTAIPEPSTAAALLGFFTLGLAALRRRRA